MRLVITMENKMPASEPVIKINGVSKKYAGSDSFALNQLSLSVFSGEVYGFLGPNGAGKSTTIRILMNFIQPSQGSATIFNKDVVKQSLDIKKTVGYLSGDFAIYPKMTGRQYLAYMNELQPAATKAYIHELSTRLKADLSKKLSELSRGNKQKIGLIQALMHKPKVLILDEPTSGLDPLIQEEFYKLIAEAKQRDTCIFVSSHILSEVQKMCDRVGIIREGKLVDEDVISKLVSEASHTFDITFAGRVPLEELKNVKGLKVGTHNQSAITIRLDGKLSDLFKVLARHNVIKIDARNLNLEKIFLKFYKDESSEK